jgi:hypothetical protein
MQKPRDMTRAQLTEILRRRGWRLILGSWIDIGGGTSIGIIRTRKRSGWKIDRRASLAKAIREATKVTCLSGLDTQTYILCQL